MVESNRLKSLFMSLQAEISLKLNNRRVHVTHSTTLGDITEVEWISWLAAYLPQRYKVDKGFIVDSTGKISHQIDIIIYDRQYSPFIFVEQNIKYIPVESVYCIMEVKQTMNKTNIEYASAKASSVDSLLVTSTDFPTALGRGRTKPFRVLRGILTTDSSWVEGITSSIFADLVVANQIDIGCSINDRSFSTDNGVIKISEKDESLIFFFLKLLSKLTELATVPALSIEAYAQALDSKF